MKDEVEAIKRYRKATEQEYDPAKKALARLNRVKKYDDFSVCYSGRGKSHAIGP